MNIEYKCLLREQNRPKLITKYQINFGYIAEQSGFFPYYGFPTSLGTLDSWFVE